MRDIRKPEGLTQEGWDNFIRTIMSLNADEALFVACALEKVGLTSVRLVPAHVRSSALKLPERLFNYSCLQRMTGVEVDADNEIIEALVSEVSYRIKQEKIVFENEGLDVSEDIQEIFDGNKVKIALRLIFSTRLATIEAYTRKLGERIEFQSLEAQAAMPVASGKIFELAYSDAEEGNERGLAWACFQLRQVFEGSSAGKFDEDEAMDLYSDLQGIPDLLLDLYGEAGLDVAERMEKMLSKIGGMSPVSVNTNTYSEMRPS